MTKTAFAFWKHSDKLAKTGWQVHAFCLMGNHFHLVVETPEQTGQWLGPNHYGTVRRETAEVETPLPDI